METIDSRRSLGSTQNQSFLKVQRSYLCYKTSLFRFKFIFLALAFLKVPLVSSERRRKLPKEGYLVCNPTAIITTRILLTQGIRDRQVYWNYADLALQIEQG